MLDDGMLITGFNGLPQTNANISMIMADFSGLQRLEEKVDAVLRRLVAQSQTQANIQFVRGGSWSMQTFDGWFAPLVRAELGKIMGIIRNKAVAKARAAGAGSASSAVLRRSYKDELKEAVHNLGSRGRISSRTRIVPEPDGGASGIRRMRSVSGRTTKIREYYGPDRSFVLRFLDSGTDIRTATSDGPTGRGSQSTHGSRGSIMAKHFFHSLSSDMEQAANELGETLINHVEKWTEQAFKDN